jgi:histidinol-phosphate aminotransferase
MTPQVKLIFLCSPGNPTAKAIPVADIERIVTAPEAQNAIVVVDEAYIDFASPIHEYSAVGLIQNYPNVVVLQTLSKAFGLAAIRCGFCIGPPDIIQLLNNVKAPYNINALTSRLAISTLDEILARPQDNVLSQNIASILQQRDVVIQSLQELDFVTKVYPSDANFVLFSITQRAHAVYKTMADAGVVIRYRGNEMHCDECLRVTIGTPDENQAFLQKLVDTYQAIIATTITSEES